jgi:hypothetical protein
MPLKGRHYSSHYWGRNIALSYSYQQCYYNQEAGSTNHPAPEMGKLKSVWI